MNPTSAVAKTILCTASVADRIVRYIDSKVRVMLNEEERGKETMEQSKESKGKERRVCTLAECTRIIYGSAQYWVQ